MESQVKLERPSLAWEIFRTDTMAASSHVLEDSLAISKATIEDVPVIKSMIDAAYSKYIDRIGKPPAPMAADLHEIIKTHDVYLLGDSKNNAVGSIALESNPESKTIKVDSIVVSPSAQGHGYGRILMNFAEDLARSRNCLALELYTNVKMYENLVLYPKMGFVETDRKAEDGYERVYFRKALD